MKRSAPKRGKGPRRTGRLPTRRVRLARSQPKRDWSLAIGKVVAEGRCRACHREGVKLDAAHIVGREHDRKSAYLVLPDRVVPLCAFVHELGTWLPGCHSRYDRHQLDIWHLLDEAERQQAIADAGSVALARKRCEPIAYRREVAA